METLVHFHAGILVIVKWADCHAMTVDLDAVHLCRLSGGKFCLTASNTFIASSFRGKKKALTFSQ
jgi:hypothetical protein